MINEFGPKSIKISDFYGEKITEYRNGTLYRLVNPMEKAIPARFNFY